MERTNLANGEFFVDINGIKHWCRIAGAENETLPIVIIHGGPGGNHYSFERTIGPLIEKYATIIYYEQRGSGRSDAPENKDDYSIKILVEDLEILRNKLGLTTINLYGYSFGGRLALEYALSYPSSVDKIIAAGPSIGDSIRETCVRLKGFEQISTVEIKEKIRLILDSDQSISEKSDLVWGIVDTDTVDRLLFVNQNFAKFNRSLWEESGIINTGEMHAALEKEVMKSPLIDRVHLIEAETLLITGLYDRNTGIEITRDLAQNMKHSRIEIMKNSAHFPDIEESSEVANIVKKFLCAN